MLSPENCILIGLTLLQIGWIMTCDTRKKSMTSLTLFSLCGGLIAATSGLQADTAPEDQTYSEYQPYCEVDLFRRDTPIYFIEAEYLYWVVNEGALDYTVKMNKPAGPEKSYAVGNFHNAEFDWSSGFRVAFGYFRAPHYWDMFLEYTYLPAFGSNEVRTSHSSDKFLNGTWSHPDVNSEAGSYSIRKGP